MDKNSSNVFYTITFYNNEATLFKLRKENYKNIKIIIKTIQTSEFPYTKLVIMKNLHMYIMMIYEKNNIQAHSTWTEYSFVLGEPVSSLRMYSVLWSTNWLDASQGTPPSRLSPCHSISVKLPPTYAYYHQTYVSKYIIRTLGKFYCKYNFAKKQLAIALIKMRRDSSAKVKIASRSNFDLKRRHVGT